MNARTPVALVSLVLFALTSACYPAPRATRSVAEEDLPRCAGQSPEAWYGAQFRDFHERVQSELDERIRRTSAELERDDIARDSNPRQLNAAAVSAHFSTESLACWSERGDQLANYVLGERFTDSELAGERVQGILFLAAAASGDLAHDEPPQITPRLCNATLAEGVVHCRYGLLEAHARLGHMLCQSGSISSRRRGWGEFLQAFLGGLWLARWQGYQECIHGDELYPRLPSPSR